MQINERYNELTNKFTSKEYWGSNGIGIDYDTRMRYVMRGGIKYWEHGSFELKQAGLRNPKFRRSVAHLFKVRFDKANEITYNLFTPEGEKLTKSQLAGNPCLLLDKEHDMVVNASNYDPVKYNCESSPPIPRNNIKVTFRDFRKEKELWPAIQEWIDWVKALKALGGDEPPYCNWINEGTWDEWVKKPCQPGPNIYGFLWYLHADGIKSIKKHFRLQTQVVREYPWLTTHGKENV